MVMHPSVLERIRRYFGKEEEMATINGPSVGDLYGELLRGEMLRRREQSARDRLEMEARARAVTGSPSGVWYTYEPVNVVATADTSGSITTVGAQVTQARDDRYLDLFKDFFVGPSSHRRDDVEEDYNK